MSSICRSCLENSEELIDMNRAPSGLEECTYLDIFCELTGLIDDGLMPLAICIECCRQLEQSFNFVQIARQSDEIFRESIIAKQLAIKGDARPRGSDDEDSMEECVIEEIVRVQQEPQIAKGDEEDVEEMEIECLEEVYLYGSNSRADVGERIEDNPLGETEQVGEFLVEYVDEQKHSQSNKKTRSSCVPKLKRKSARKSAKSPSLRKQNAKNCSTYTCDDCNEEYRHARELKEHDWFKHKQQRCRKCQLVLDGACELKLHHSLSHTAVNNLLCNLCPPVVGSEGEEEPLNRKALFDHLRQYHNKFYEKHKDTVKDYSDVAAQESPAVEQQEEDTSKLAIEVLNEQEKSKPQEGGLQRTGPTEEVRKETKFFCAYCSRQCKNIKTLTQHERLHEGESDDVVYQCGDCDRHYRTQNHLELHRRQAHKERDNLCAICGNAFKLKNQLMNHMKLHLEKNIQCTMCDKKYARPFDLKVHMRSHTGEQPYACHLCDKRFAIKVRLTYHLQRHYGIKHRCKECGAEFNSKQKLKAHSFKHTGMPYRCELCHERGFCNRNLFKRHLLRVHNYTMSDEALVEMFQRNTGKTIRIQSVGSSEDCGAENTTEDPSDFVDESSANVPERQDRV